MRKNQAGSNVQEQPGIKHAGVFQFKQKGKEYPGQAIKQPTT